MKVVAAEDGSVSFKCPGCGRWHVVNHAGNVRWNFNGDVDNPTIFPNIVCKTLGSQEVSCHCIVENGKIRFLPDSKHALAGMVIDLPHL